MGLCRKLPSLVILPAILGLTGVAVVAAEDPGNALELEPVERQVWNGRPLPVRLVAGTELQMRIIGHAGLRVGLLDGPLPGVRIQSLGDSLYLRSSDGLREGWGGGRRILVTSDTGGKWLFDLTATDDAEHAGSARLLEIHPQPSRQIQTRDSASEGVANEARPFGYVALTRFASQSLYAPDRLLPLVEGVAPVRIDKTRTVSLIRGGVVESGPVAAWRADRGAGGRPLWVTAVVVRNLTTTPISDLDPRDIRGEWLAATFQHTWLGRRGDSDDSTVVYLVSDRTFTEAASVWGGER